MEAVLQVVLFWTGCLLIVWQVALLVFGFGMYRQAKTSCVRYHVRISVNVVPGLLAVVCLVLSFVV